MRYEIKIALDDPTNSYKDKTTHIDLIRELLQVYVNEIQANNKELKIDILSIRTAQE